MLSLVMAAWRRSPGSLAAIATAAACVALFARDLAAEPRVFHSSGLASKKGESAELEEREPAPLLATLVQTHTEERVLLDRDSPSSLRFDALLADRATASSTPLDPRLLGLLRELAVKFGSPDAGPRAFGMGRFLASERIELPSVELVSGFRSPKLNEMLRKKGHHVASHSQHSLGHAVDFRIVVPRAGTTALALDPRVVQRAIRALGWDGGTGIYTSPEDWFVHADVGPNRTWYEGPVQIAPAHSAPPSESGPVGPEAAGMPRLPDR